MSQKSGRATSGPNVDYPKEYQYEEIENQSPIYRNIPRNEIRIGPRPRIASSSIRQITQATFINQKPCR